MTRKPIILTNAFRRPRGSYTNGGVSVCDKTYVYACIEDVINVITDNMHATPLITPVIPDADGLAHILDSVDGILLPGGFSNIHPSFYGERDNGLSFPDCDKNHDQTDLILVKEAVKRKIPILGICRGMQAMNVAMGGTLKFIDHNNKQDNFDQGSDHSVFIDHSASCSVDGISTDPAYMHDMMIEPNTKISNILNSLKCCAINTMHEQVIGALGQSITVEAKAEDGVIEAISINDHPFAFGVQWHPEAQRNTETSQKIFDAFVNSIVENNER
jgi:gamma-glutamyl-gamma-aminobutyrate hydrolase PuuD